MVTIHFGPVRCFHSSCVCGCTFCGQKVSIWSSKSACQLALFTDSSSSFSVRNRVEDDAKHIRHCYFFSHLKTLWKDPDGYKTMAGALCLLKNTQNFNIGLMGQDLRLSVTTGKKNPLLNTFIMSTSKQKLFLHMTAETFEIIPRILNVTNCIVLSFFLYHHLNRN